MNKIEAEHTPGHPRWHHRNKVKDGEGGHAGDFESCVGTLYNGEHVACRDIKLVLVEHDHMTWNDDVKEFGNDRAKLQKSADTYSEIVVNRYSYRVEDA